MTDPRVAKLAKEIARLDRQYRALSTSPRLAHTSIEDSTLPEYDADGNLVARYGKQPDGSHGSYVITGPKPPTPLAPEAEGGPLTVTAFWGGTYVGEAATPMDFKGVEVYAAQTPFSAIEDAALVGVIPHEDGGRVTFSRPVGTWHIGLVAVSTAMRRSDVSELTTVEVTSVVDQGALDELNDRLGDAEQSLNEAQQWIADTGAQLDTNLSTLRDDLDNLQNVTLPNVTGRVDTLENETLPALDSSLTDLEGELSGLESGLAANADEVANLRDVTVPGIADDLATARQELEQADAGLDERLDELAPIVESRPVMLFGTGEPSGTAPQGSVWFRTNAAGQITGQWQQVEASNTGAQWEQREVRSEVIANLDVGKLTAGSATISEAVIEKLWAEVIHARKITSDMLVVGNSSNLVDNPGLSGGSMDGWEVVSGGWSVVSFETRNVLRTTIFGGGLIRNLRRFDCVPGDQYRFTVSIRGAGSGDKIARIRWYDSDGADLDASTELSAHGHAWTNRSTTVTAPAGAFSGQLEIEVIRTGNNNYEVMFAVPEIRPMTGPALIVDGAVTAEKVDAESVAAAVGTFLDLSAEQITSGTISTARLNAAEVAAAVGQFLELSAGQITSGKISAGQIDAQDIAAAVGAFITLSTDQLVAGSAAIDTAVVDKLWTDVIRARKITSDMLVIGGTRLIDNPIFEPDESGTWGPGWLHPSEDPTARGTAEFYKPDDLDANAVRFMSDGENGFLINMPNTRRAAVTPGQEIRVAADVKVPDGPGVIFGINFRDRDGEPANNGATVIVPSTGNVWQRFEGSFVVPDDGSVTMEFVVVAILGTGSATVAISNVDMRPKTGPELIVDGGIEARHITASEAMWTKVLGAHKINAEEIDVQDLAADEALVGLLRTAILIAGSVKANMLDVEDVDPTTGQRMTLLSDGLRLYSADSDDLPMVSLTSSEAQNLTVLNPATGDASSMDSGSVSSRTIAANESLLYRGEEVQDLLDTRWRTVARSFRAAPLPGFTILGVSRSRGLIELSFMAKAGRMYRIESDIIRADFGPNTQGNRFVVYRIRYTTGTTPLTLSSPELAHTAYGVHTGGNVSVPVQVSAMGVSWPQDTQVNLLWDVSTGGPTVTHHASTPGRLFVTDIGPALPDTGAPSTLLSPRGGAPPDDGEGSEGNANQVREYLREYTAVKWAGSYQVSNGGAEYVDELGRLRHGLTNNEQGIFRSQIGFPDAMFTDIAGSQSILEVSIGINTLFWRRANNQAITIGAHGNNSKPTSYSGYITGDHEVGIYPYSTRWITLPSSWYSSFLSGTYRGVTLGHSVGSAARFGGFIDGADIRVRVRHTK